MGKSMMIRRGSRLEASARNAVRSSLWLVLPAGLLVALLWSPGLSGPYFFDDYVTPLSDPASQSLSAWVSALGTTLRPVTKLTYALEAEGGLQEAPGARRVVSIFMLVVAAILFGCLVHRLDRRLSLVGVGFLAMVWALHPVHADSVLAVSGRTAVLSALFLMASMLALESGRTWLALACFVLAGLSRETALAGALPLALLALTQPAQPWSKRVRSSLPVFMGFALALGWMVTTPRYWALADFSLFGRPILSSTVSQVAAVPVGLNLLLREPGSLSIDYGIPLPTQPAAPLFWFGLLLYLAAAVGIVLFRHRSRPVVIGLALWLAALLPTQSLIPKLDPLTNRPLSLAWAGLVLLLVPILSWIQERPAPGLAKAALGVIALGLVCGLGVLTAQRSTLFRSELALWQDAASKSVANARPHLQYALLLRASGEEREAALALAAAREIDPFSSRIEALWRAYGGLEEKK